MNCEIGATCKSGFKSQQPQIILSSDLMKLIVARHGETIENVKGISTGHLPGTLTERGIRQARVLGTKLKREKIDAIYSSDLRRASETAKEISLKLGIPVNYTKELRERNFGELQGKKGGPTLKSAFPMSFEPKNAESLSHLNGRIRRFLADVVKKHKNDTVLFVTHGGVMHVLQAIAEKKTLEQLRASPRRKNIDFAVFEFN